MKILEEVVKYNFIRTEFALAVKQKKVLQISSFECVGDAFDNWKKRVSLLF